MIKGGYMSAPTSIDWSLITQILGFIGVIITIVTATHKITKRFTEFEGRIKNIEENPLLVAFKKTETELTSALVSADNIIKGYEAKKVSKKEEGEEEKK